MLNVFIIIFTVLILVVSSASLAFLFISSNSFRKKIAVPHGFFEGLITGASLPGLIFSYALIFIQTASFIAFPTHKEIFIILRMFLFLITFFMFFMFRFFTPPLLSLWFGKHSLWFCKGEKGKIPYDSIYGACVENIKTQKPFNNQQLYKISFFTTDRKFFSFPMRMSCRLTAKQIGSLTKSIRFRQKDHLSFVLPSVYQLKTFVSFIVSVSLSVVVFLLLCSYGVFSGNFYSKDFSVSETETVSVEEISDVIESDSELFVCYRNVSTINVYDKSGKFLRSVSFPCERFRVKEAGVVEDIIYFRSGNKVFKCTTDGEYVETVDYSEGVDGIFEQVGSRSGYSHDSYNVYDKNGNVIVKRPDYYSLFYPGVLWVFAVMLLISLFSIKFLSEHAEAVNLLHVKKSQQNLNNLSKDDKLAM